VTLDPDGMPCGCGNRGCLETYAAAPAIVRYAAAAIDAGRAPRLASRVQAGEPLTPELVSRAAAEGEKAAADAFAEAGRWLGIAVGSYLNIFDPDRIVIGGGVAASLDLILPALTDEARRRSFKVIHDHVTIVPAELGDDAGVVGAAAPFFLDRR